VGVAVGRSPDTGLTLAVTYNGVPMTSAGIVHANSRTDGFVQLFYVKAPAAGAHTVQVTLTGGTASIEAGSVSFSNVDQTTPLRNIGTLIKKLETRHAIRFDRGSAEIRCTIPGAEQAIRDWLQTL